MPVERDARGRFIKGMSKVPESGRVAGTPNVMTGVRALLLRAIGESDGDKLEWFRKQVHENPREVLRMMGGMFPRELSIDANVHTPDLVVSAEAQAKRDEALTHAIHQVVELQAQQLQAGAPPQPLRLAVPPDVRTVGGGQE